MGNSDDMAAHGGHMQISQVSPAVRATRYGFGLTKKLVREKKGAERDFFAIHF